MQCNDIDIYIYIQVCNGKCVMYVYNVCKACNACNVSLCVYVCIHACTGACM